MSPSAARGPESFTPAALLGRPIQNVDAGNGADAEYTATAMTAGPPEVVHDATIVRTVNGAMQTLRKGTNEFTCMVADVGPMCMGPNAMEWAHAWQTHTRRPINSDLSTRSTATRGRATPIPERPNKRPAITGSRRASRDDRRLGVKHMAGFPRRPDPDPTKPYVMSAGTPYEHLMLPVNPDSPAHQIRWRAATAGIEAKLGNHSFPATGITAYFKNGCTLEKAAAMENHASTRTTQLYDRLSEVARTVKSGRNFPPRVARRRHRAGLRPCLSALPPSRKTPLPTSNERPPSHGPNLLRAKALRSRFRLTWINAAGDAPASMSCFKRRAFLCVLST